MNQDEAAKRVLVIEDYPNDVRLVERVLSTLPVPIVTTLAQETRDAMRISEKCFPLDSYFDLVLLDSRLLGVSSFEVLKALRNADPFGKVPIVLLIGAAGDDFSEIALGHGADACVVKPLDPEMFMKKVRKIADTWLHLA
jgi:CheY-like chemotaxis protein